MKTWRIVSVSNMAWKIVEMEGNGFLVLLEFQLGSKFSQVVAELPIRSTKNISVVIAIFQY